MKIIYMRDHALEAQMDTLIYRELRDMVPKFPGHRLPRPGTLLDELHGRFLEVSDSDYSIRIYMNGLYLYREPGKATVYSVHKCAKIAFPSLEDGLHVTDMRDFVWFLPLKIAGEFRVDHNSDSREEHRNVFHFEDEIPVRLMPCTPDFVREADPEEEADAEERAYRKKCAKMMSALTELTDRQKEILMLSRVEKKKQKDIAAELGICKSTVSTTIHRAERTLGTYS